MFNKFLSLFKEMVLQQLVEVSYLQIEIFSYINAHK